MEQWKKQLRKIPRNDRERIFVALFLILKRDVATLDKLQLKGHRHIFRVRVGEYRIVYHDDGDSITVKTIARRDENTYKAF